MLPDGDLPQCHTATLPDNQKSDFRISGLYPVDRDEVLKKPAPMNRERAIGILNAFGILEDFKLLGENAITLVENGESRPIDLG